MIVLLVETIIGMQVVIEYTSLAGLGALVRIVVSLTCLVTLALGLRIRTSAFVCL